MLTHFKIIYMRVLMQASFDSLSKYLSSVGRHVVNGSYYLILHSHCFSLVVTQFLPLLFFAVTHTRMLQPLLHPNRSHSHNRHYALPTRHLFPHPFSRRIQPPIPYIFARQPNLAFVFLSPSSK